jgi:hypothetical protein
MQRAVMFVATVILAASTAASSEAQDPAPRTAPPADVRLTYTARFSPAFPTMAGAVGGDVAGRLGGAIVRLSPPEVGQRFLHITSVYIVAATNPSRSFTARLQGTQDNAGENACRVGRCTGTATGVLDGRVVDGWLTGRHVHAEYTVVSCTDAPELMCFNGTLTVRRGAA